MTFRVRKANIQDLPEVYLFELGYIKEIEPEAEPGWKNAAPQMLRQWITNLPRMFILLRDTESIGHCFWQIEDKEALLASIYVSPAYRRQGCGARLLNSFEQDAISQGFTHLTLCVHESNPASALYKQAGYLATQKKRNGAYDGYEKFARATIRG